MKPAVLDRLDACFWVAPSVSAEARKNVAAASPLVQCISVLPTQMVISHYITYHERALTSPGSDEVLDAWMRGVYATYTSTETVRDCIQILCKYAVARKERDVSRELLRIACPDINDVRSGRPVMFNVPRRRLVTAQDMVNRAAKVGMGVSRCLL